MSLQGQERRGVDAVAGAERSGQDQARLERGTAARLEVLSEDVRRVRPQVGPEELAERRRGRLVEVLKQLVGSVAPREVRIRLVKSTLPQPVHHLRPRERLGQE